MNLPTINWPEDDVPPPPPRIDSSLPRLLFLTIEYGGFRTLSRELEAHTAARNDIVAQHVRLTPSRWMRALGRGAPVFRPSEWDQHRVRHAALWRRALSGRLAMLLDSHRFDVVQAATQSCAWGMADVVHSRAGRYVVQIDATGELMARELGASRRALAPFIAIERAIFAESDAVACWTHWSRRSVIEDYGVAAARAFIARPGTVDVIAPAPRRDGPLRIGFIGHAWKRKGGDRLLRWHRTWWADRFELHVFGYTPRRFPVVRNVFWHGPQPREAVMQALARDIDLVVIPTMHDTLVLALLEAQSRGVPVVSSRLAGIPEAVRDEETGVLCEVNNSASFRHAIERLLGDASARAAMGAAARDFISSSWSRASCLGVQVSRLAAIGAGRALEAESPAPCLPSGASSAVPFVP